jgi:thioredoxin reductase (NADPH)
MGATDEQQPDRPVLLAVDDDVDALQRISEQLNLRYGTDYNVLCEQSPVRAREQLGEMRVADKPVALVLASQWMEDDTGADLLAYVKHVHPRAKRGLMVDWGAWEDTRTTEAILNAMALGHIDYYVLKPWSSPDEFFHRTITEFLHEWRRQFGQGTAEVEVVGERWSPKVHELTTLLSRNGFPHVFHPRDSEEGRRILRECGCEEDNVPVVRILRKKILRDPSREELAAAYGVSTRLDSASDCDFDVVVVGAGPAGLASAVAASSEGLRTLVIEREAIGGQAGSSTLIRNYPGFSRGVSGAELAQRAYQQAWVFGAKLLLTQSVIGLQAIGDRHVVELSDGSRAMAKAVVLATGVSYRRLGIPELEELSGAGVFYGASVSDAQALTDHEVYIVGGGNSAGQAAMHLRRYARRVFIVVRGTSLADSMSQYLRDTIAAHPDDIEVLLETQVVGGGGEGRLQQLVLRDGQGEQRTVEAAALFVMIGAVPRKYWFPEEIELDEWGYVKTGRDAVDAKREKGWGPPSRAFGELETCVPGVFAAGDLRHGAVKRVASAVGEGSAVVRQVLEFLEGESPGGPVRWEAAAQAGGPGSG